MSLIKRIVDIWTSSADQELFRVLDEWRVDFAYDEEFIHVVGVLESHIVDEEYTEALELFADYYPLTMIESEVDHFLWLLDEALNYEF